MGTFCPFVKEGCRRDCKFYSENVGQSKCVIYDGLYCVGDLFTEVQLMRGEIKK
jgi:hypothetical protein